VNQATVRRLRDGNINAKRTRRAAEFEIEQNVAIPSRYHRRTWPFEQLTVATEVNGELRGPCLKFARDFEHTVRAAISDWRRKHGNEARFTIRNDPHDDSVSRCWRIK
jgi:hypothetical protein